MVGRATIHISRHLGTAAFSPVTQTLGPILTKLEPLQKMSILRKIEDSVLFIRSSGHLVDDRVRGVVGEPAGLCVVGAEEDGWRGGVDWAAPAKPRSLTHFPPWPDS